MRYACNCKKKKGITIPSLTCKSGSMVNIYVLDDLGSLVWYNRTIAAWKLQHSINLIGFNGSQAIVDERDLKLLCNPDTSKLIIRVTHHLLGVLYYHGDKIYAPWTKPAYGPDLPPEYKGERWLFGTPYRRRGKQSLPLPTKWAVSGLIDQALYGVSNT